MKHQGHIWSEPTLKEGQPFNRHYRVKGYFMECRRCFIVFMARYPLPDETMDFLGVPSCDDYIVSQVMSA